MPVFVISMYQLSLPQIDPQLNSSTHILRRKSIAVRCCHREAKERPRKFENYYEMLDVSVGSSPKEIKEAYRNLQKKYHPDIAGQRGHEHTLLLNEAYKVLMTEDLRREYDASIGHVGVRFGKDASNLGHSSWNGPLRPQALFVDENACIGCRECVHHASNTFIMDETHGCARVRLQYGDDDTNIMVSVESCPVNCIHWVETEELQVLEHLMQPQIKEGYGIFGHGWERPKNVFMAAKAFSKQLQRQAENIHKHGYCGCSTTNSCKRNSCSSTSTSRCKYEDEDGKLLKNMELDEGRSWQMNTSHIAQCFRATDRRKSNNVHDRCT